jgi:hypothetical protein
MDYIPRNTIFGNTKIKTECIEMIPYGHYLVWDGRNHVITFKGYIK